MTRTWHVKEKIKHFASVYKIKSINPKSKPKNDIDQEVYPDT